MPRRIADYAQRRLERPQPGGHGRRVHDRGEHDPVPLERLHLAAAAARSPVTIRGRRTRSSGRRARRRRRTTSTTCPEIRSERPLFDLRHGRTATPDSIGGRRRRARSRPPTTSDATPRRRAQPGRRPVPRRPGRDQQPDPRDDPVHLLGGDVLLRAVRRLLQRPGRARQWPPIVQDDPALTERFNLHAEPWFAAGLTLILIISSFTCQLARLGDPARRPDRLHPGDRRSRSSSGSSS